MKRLLKPLFISIFVILWLISGSSQPAYATASVTTATGGSSINADTTGGSYAALTGPTITEGANKDVGTGTLILNAPSGFIFNTGQNVTGTVSLIAGSKSCFTLSAGTVTPATTTITFTVSAQDGTGGNPTTTCRIVFTNIQVRPSSGTPLASGNITVGGTSSITGITSSTNLGTLTEVVGAKNKLSITQQPSSTAVINTNFTTKPIVALQDQFSNTVTTDSSSTITESVYLSGASSCSGSAGTGTLTSTPTSGTAVSSGLMTYSALQYSVAESIKICFSSTGVTSALSNAVNVVTTPTVTTQSASSVKDTSASANGNITSTGGENNDKEGFVYDTASHSLPGNVVPGSSGYASHTENTGSFGTGAFTVSLTGLSSGVTYYGRTYSHNSAGYSYGGEINFTTAIVSISITSDGTISYGIVSSGVSKNTTASDLNDTQTARNDSTIAEDFNIKTSNATGGTTWSVGSSPGTNTYVHEFSTNSGTNWTVLTTADSYQALATNIAASSSQNFDMRITLPSTTSDYVQKTITITIQAVAH